MAASAASIPGDVLIAEDVTGHGHIARSVEDQYRVSFAVPPGRPQLTRRRPALRRQESRNPQKSPVKPQETSPKWENDEFAQRLQAKIERLTDRAIDLEIDHNEPNQLQIETRPGNPPGHPRLPHLRILRLCPDVRRILGSRHPGAAQHRPPRVPPAPCPQLTASAAGKMNANPPPAPEPQPESQPEPESQSQPEPEPPPPEQLKPWYYQYWFLYPAFMFWPVWSILILRSPWHNGLISGAIAWAALFVGSYALYTWSIGGRDGINALLAGNITPPALLAGQIILPGILLTIITQTHWQRHRHRIMTAAHSSRTATAADKAATATSNAPARNNNAPTSPQKPAPSRPSRRRRPHRRRKPR